MSGVYARMIRRGDEKLIAGLARKHHADSRYAHLPFDEERVLKLCEAFNSLKHYGAVVLDTGGSEVVVGYCGVVIEPYMWADITIARELAVYIHPEHRSFSAFTVMMRLMEHWCRAKKVHTMDFGISTPVDDDECKRYGKLYERIGYEWHGVRYKKELVA